MDKGAEQATDQGVAKNGHSWATNTFTFTLETPGKCMPRNKTICRHREGKNPVEPGIGNTETKR